jgi:hypothetical protein
MSRPVTYENPEQSLNDTHDDGRAFQHQQELHRDSALNGGTIAVFDIERQALTRATHKAARRMEWDDACGMDDGPFRNVFGKISLSATLMASPYLGPDPDPRYHARKGHGGRATTVVFNGYGFVTITIFDGVGRMMWWFRKLDGKYALRDLPIFESDVLLDGVTDFVVPPYVEPNWIDYDNDPDFAEVLISLGMEEGEDGEGSRVVRNPEAGLDWRQVPLQHAVLIGSPAGKGKQMADDFTVVSNGVMDTVIFEKGGLPAHGTAKIMLGESPNDDTALTGDPYFREERSPDEYASWLHQHLWEMPVETYVWGLFPRIKGQAHSTFKLEVPDPETGTTVTKQFAAQQRQSLGVEEHFFGPLDPTNPFGREYIEWQSKPLKVDEHGTMLKVTVVKDDTPGLNTNWKASGRQGFIGGIYNNEVYEVDQSPALYRSFGIGKDLKDRTFFIFTPPIADGRPATYHEGVFNDGPRSGIQWFPGSVKLHRLYPKWADNYLFIEPDEIKAMKSANAPQATVEDPEFRKRYSELFNEVADAFRSAANTNPATGRKRPRKARPEWMKDPDAEAEPAYIEGRDSEPMTDEGIQGAPGDNKRPPLNCDLCNPDDDPDIHFHDPDCPNKPEPKDNWEDSGTKGDNRKGRRDKDGKILGGESKAKVRPKIKREDKKKKVDDGRIDFEPPTLDPGVFDPSEKWFIFNWRPADGDPQAMTKAGIIGVNIDLAVVKSWLGQVDAGTNPNRPINVGNIYFLAEMERYVLESPGYEPEAVVDAVYGVYTDTVCQAVVVAIAHRVNKMPWQEIHDSFLTAEALTTSVLAQADLRQRIKARIAGLPRRGASTP